MALNTWAVTRRSLVRVPNFLQSINALTPYLESTLMSVRTRAAFVRSSVVHSSGIVGGSVSIQWSIPAHSHSGPRHHSWFTDTSRADSPLDGRSAGLDFPGQWLQRLGATLRRISVTLFSTKGFHSLFVPCIQ